MNKCTRDRVVLQLRPYHNVGCSLFGNPDYQSIAEMKELEKSKESKNNFIFIARKDDLRRYIHKMKINPVIRRRGNE